MSIKPAEAPAPSEVRPHLLFEALVEYPGIVSRRLGETLPAPGRRPALPGMTTIHEQAYAEWYAMELYSGRGELVELGTYLGSLSRGFARGLSANARPQVAGKKLRAFDIFQWDHVMEANVRGTPNEGRFSIGDDYRPYYLELLGPIAERVEATAGDLVHYRWGGEPIEFLCVDVLKYEALAATVQPQFYPSLLPGGILMQQDYFHGYEVWVTLSMYQLRAFFHPLLALPQAQTALFICRQAPPAELCGFPARMADVDDAWIEEAFAWSRSWNDDWHEPFISSTHFMAYIHKGDVETGRRLAREAWSRFEGHPILAEMIDYCRDALSIDVLDHGG